MKVETYDAGSAIMIEVEFKKYAPFDDYTYFDPLIKTITVTDPLGVKKIDAEVLTQVTSGKYKFIIQSAISWEKGSYVVQIDSDSAGNTDVTIDPESFYLK